MSVEIVSGKFQANNAIATNVECGFVPDYLQLISDLGGTEKHFKWFKVLYDYAATGTGKYGWDVDIAPVRLNGETNGIIPYDTSVESVFLPATDGNGYIKAPSIADWLATDTPVQRVAGGVLGSVIRPTTHNGFVYECTVSGGVMGTEPTTWPTVPGETVSDTNNTYVCRIERVVRSGVKGFTIGATLSVDGVYWVFKAEKHDRYNYMGDARIEDPVTFADHHHI